MRYKHLLVGLMVVVFVVGFGWQIVSAAVVPDVQCSGPVDIVKKTRKDTFAQSNPGIVAKIKIFFSTSTASDSVQDAVICIQSPNGGETVTLGKSLKISWVAHRISPNYQLRVTIRKGSKTIGDYVASSTKRSLDVYLDPQVALLQEGGDYLAEVRLHEKGDMLTPITQDQSDKPFTITPINRKNIIGSAGIFSFFGDLFRNLKIGVSQPQAADIEFNCKDNTLFTAPINTWVGISSPGVGRWQVWSRSDMSAVRNVQCFLAGDCQGDFPEFKADTDGVIINAASNLPQGYTCRVRFYDPNISDPTPSPSDNAPPAAPTLDLLCDNDPTDTGLNFIQGPCTNSAAILTWSGANLSSCTASASPASSVWNGSRPISGPATVETATTLRTYTLTCLGTNGASVSKSVVVMPRGEVSPEPSILPRTVSLAPLATSIGIGEPLSVEYKALPGANINDWVGLFPVGDIPTSSSWNSAGVHDRVWKWLDNTSTPKPPTVFPSASGRISISVPRDYVGQEVVFVYFRNGRFDRASTSDKIKILPHTIVSVAPTPSAIPVVVARSPKPKPTSDPFPSPIPPVVPPGCVLKQVQCVRAPCEPQVICPTTQPQTVTPVSLGTPITVTLPTTQTQGTWSKLVTVAWDVQTRQYPIVSVYLYPANNFTRSHTLLSQRSNTLGERQIYLPNANPFPGHAGNYQIKVEECTSFSRKTCRVGFSQPFRISPLTPTSGKSTR